MGIDIKTIFDLAEESEDKEADEEEKDSEE